MGCRQGIMVARWRKFGAFPSNIWTARDDWVQGRKEASAQAQVGFDAILREKFYKKHGADYCVMLFRQQLLADPLEIGPVSAFEWIVSPRLKQVGCFMVAPRGVVNYVRWVVEQ